MKLSFSSEVKEELSVISNYNKTNLRAELLGYFFSGNMNLNNNTYEYVTENEFNIEHFYKILFNLKIDYEPEIYGKCFLAKIEKENVKDFIGINNEINEEEKKNIVKGVFLGAGSISNPEKKYELFIQFNSKENAKRIIDIAKDYGIYFKSLENKSKEQIYLKDGEEIARFLALIGAVKSLLKYENIRIVRDKVNNVNRLVNCETANLTKTINAAVAQVEDIQIIISKGKFEDLPENLKDIANLRLENPDMSLKDLSEMTKPSVSKSGVNHRLKKLHEIAKELRN